MMDDLVRVNTEILRKQQELQITPEEYLSACLLVVANNLGVQLPVIFADITGNPADFLAGKALNQQKAAIKAYCGNNRISNETLNIALATLIAEARNIPDIPPVSLEALPDAQKLVFSNAPPVNLPPLVAIIAPVPGTVLPQGQSTTISASATDSDGSISSVDFRVNGVSIGVATVAPYSRPWTPPEPGIYRLSAIASDNRGGTRSSTPVTVIVTGTGNSPSPTPTPTPASAFAGARLLLLGVPI